MEYLTLRYSSARGPIYEKDFSVVDVFAPFVRQIISNLVQVGIIKEGQTYQATITPGYEAQAEFDRPRLKSGAEAEFTPTKAGWLALATPLAGGADAPLRYFKLTVQILPPPQAQFYEKDFPMGELSYLTNRVQAALQQMLLVGEGEAVRAEFFARSGNAPRFDHETIFAVPDALNTLAINVESVSAQDRFPERPMPPRDHVAADEPADRLVIFFQAEGMKRLSAYVQQHASRRQESGGVLIGQVYREPPAGRLYLIIEDFIPAEQIQADQVSLRFTHETWQKLQAAKQARFAAEQQIVGWYHTHPPLPLTADEGAARTVQFFSLDDVSVHRQLFNRPWQVALVMDAESSEKVFYRWEGERVVKSDYYLLA